MEWWRAEPADDFSANGGRRSPLARRGEATLCAVRRRMVGIAAQVLQPLPLVRVRAPSAAVASVAARVRRPEVAAPIRGVVEVPGRAWFDQTSTPGAGDETSLDLPGPLTACLLVPRAVPPR
jgi:hypothetical protein